MARKEDVPAGKFTALYLTKTAVVVKDGIVYKLRELYAAIGVAR
jgi:hypothetical protein